MEDSQNGMGCMTEPDQTSPSSVTQTFDLSRQKPLRPHQLGAAEDQTVTVLVCVAKPNSRLRPDWEPCGPQRSYLSGRFPVAWLPACSCSLLLPECNGVLSHPAAWTLPSCPPCAMLCPPHWQLLTHADSPARGVRKEGCFGPDSARGTGKVCP